MVRTVLAIARSAAGVLLLLCSTVAFPQSGFDMAYDVEKANQSRLPGDFVGESINLFDRSVDWSVVDVSLPGKGPTIEIGRYHRHAPSGAFDVWRGDMYNWSLDVPRISVAHSLYGLDDHGGRMNALMYGCGLGNPRSVNIVVRGAGDFRPIALNPAIDYPLLQAQAPHAQFNNNWLAYCGQSITTRSYSTDSSGSPLPSVTATAVTLLSPDGTKYHFVYQSTEKMSLTGGPKKPSDPGWGTVVRDIRTLYVTDVEDRFGNWLAYHYERRSDNGGGTVLRLRGVTASDGRSVTLNYRVDDHGQTGITDSGRHLESVTTNGRTWAYHYQDTPIPQLVRVEDPVDREWEYQYYTPGSTPGPSRIHTVTTPSGAVVEYEYENMRYATYQLDCDQLYVASSSGGHVAVKKRTVTSGGVIVSLDNYQSSYLKDPVEADRHFLVTEVVGLSSKDRYFHACYDPQSPYSPPSSGLIDPRHLSLARHETYGGSGLGTLQRVIDTEWRSQSYSGNYRHNLGPIRAQSISRLWEGKVTTTIGSDQFVTDYGALDAFGQPTTTAETNSLGSSRSGLVEYHNDTSLWVLGQVARNVVGGIEESATDYGWMALPWKSFSFGKLQQEFGYETVNVGQFGTLKSVKDGNGDTTWFTSWKRGTPQAISYPDGAAQSAVVDDNGWIVSVIDERGNQTSYAYDDIGRLTSIAYPLGWAGKAITYEMLPIGELGVPAGFHRVRSTHGRWQQSAYEDGLGRTVLVEEKDTVTGVASYTRSVYNDKGWVTFSSYPAETYLASAGVTDTYDAIGRLTLRQATGGVTLQSRQYLPGNKVSTTDADGRVSTVTYQAFGRPKQDDPTLIAGELGQTTVITRDHFGKIVTVVQSGPWEGGTLSASRTLAYDGHHRLCRRTDPESGSTIWGYDNAGQVIWELKGQGGSGCVASQPSGATLFQYDSRGRKVSEDYPGSVDDIVYVYDAAGNLSSVSTGAAVWSYEYNSRNLLEKETVGVDGKVLVLDPVYNNLGHVDSIATPVRSISYSPDAWGRPTTLGGYIAAIDYHPDGQVSSYSTASGLVYSLTLDALRRPQAQNTTSGGVSVQKFVYGYTNAGDLTSIVDQANGGAANLTASYDALHRLQSAAGIWGGYTYTYDPLSNVRARAGSSGLTYVYDSNLRLTGVSGSVSRSYSYSASGEVVADGAHSFVLNGRGQIRGVPGVASYDYDGNGRRIKAVRGAATEYTLYDRSGKLVYFEVGADQFDVLALDGKSLVEIRRSGGADVVTYHHPDLLGSPRMVTGGSAGLEHYAPYGAKLNGLNQKIGYTGHAHDAETGLTYAQARFYDPEIGRFLSPDPIWFLADNESSFNRYAYANNNPYKYVDKDGQVANFVFKFVADVAMESAIQYLTTGSVDFGAALTDAGVGLFNPLKSVERAKDLARMARAGGDALGAAAGVSRDARRVAEHRNLRAKRREQLSRKEPGGARDQAGNPQKQSGDGFRKHDAARRGPSGERPAGPDRSNNRERNIGIEEEHSIRPKGGFR